MVGVIAAQSSAHDAVLGNLRKVSWGRGGGIALKTVVQIRHGSTPEEWRFLTAQILEHPNGLIQR